MERKPNHDLRGRPYADSVETRAEQAKQMIYAMTALGRCPRMSIPAGDLLHSTPCGDEDLFICDVIDDLLAARAAGKGA